mgnify:CR=1 FL=1
MCEERKDVKAYHAPYFSKIDFFEFKESDEDVDEYDSCDELKYDAKNNFLEALGRSERFPTNKEGNDLFQDFQYPTFEAMPDCDLAAFLTNEEEILPFHANHVAPYQNFSILIICLHTYIYDAEKKDLVA